MIIAALVIALLIFLSALDDLIMDLLYLLSGRKQARRLKVSELSAAPQQRIAVLIPAWDEGIVIGQMLRTTLELQRYARTRYHLFVGVYPNDPATQAAVDEVAAQYPNVHKVVSPQPGPTTKAANLNAMYEAMQALERHSGSRFDVVVMHDAEDVIHPLAFKLYNYLIPGADMAQIPVLPIQPAPTVRNFFTHLTAGTYADEFAENHLRHMLVRERFGGFVPSAGVGTALSRRAVDYLTEQGGGNPFANHSLTEDYEMSLRLASAGWKTVYFLEGVERVDRNGQIQVEYIATRETFPNHFWQAVKQKTRWIYGITMQNAEATAPRGTFGQRYLRYRDAKGKITNLVTVPAYLVTLYFLLHWLILGTFPETGALEKPLMILLALNTFLWVERQVVRFLALSQQYGKREALLGTMLPPLLPIRFFWGSLINLVATTRAWQLRLFGSVSNKRKWAKTEHTFFAPPELLESYRRRLGDVALEHGVLCPEQLRATLGAERAESAPLGELLLKQGVIDVSTLRTLLADLHHSWHIAIEQKLWDPAASRWLPLEAATHHKAVPLLIHDQWLVVVTEAPLTPAARSALAALSGLQLQEVLADTDTVQTGLKAVYQPQPESRPAQIRLGNLLLAQGVITLSQLIDGLQEQARTGAPLGQALVRLGYLNEARLQDSLRSQRGPQSA